MAKEYSSRPSQLLGIEDPYSAWCLDDAVYAWGTHVEAELKRATTGAKNEAEAKRKHDAVWNKLFRGEGGPDTNQFRDPMSVMKR